MDSKNYVIRPVEQKDLEAIFEIAKEVGPGFTSLPNDPKYLEKKVDKSLKSFKSQIPLDSRSFLFVMEELSAGKVIGTSAIEVTNSFPWPSFQWKLFKHFYGTNRFEDRHMHQLMVLANDLTNSSEFGTLYLNPLFRGEKRGEILSRMRGLFVAEFPSFFSDNLIAEMRGVSDDSGYSPFYETVIKPFFNIDFKTADLKRTLEGKQFVSELLPRYPIYIDLFPPNVRSAIGITHDKTKPALHVLNKEGFAFKDYIDILDGGPVVEIQKSDLKTAKYSKVATLEGIFSESDLSNSGNVTSYLLCNSEIAEDQFRSIFAEAMVNDKNQIFLKKEQAELLKVSKGSRVRYCAFDYEYLQ